MLKNINITQKFPLLMISLALISALATGVIAFSSASNGMRSAAEDKLISLLESRKFSLHQYFNIIQQDLAIHAQSPLLIEAVKDFSQAWDELPEDKTSYLQRQYIHKNPFTAGQKGALLSGKDVNGYNQHHRKYHPVFRNLIKARSFYDLFLFDTQGNMIYSVSKEADFATNIISGRWSKSHLSAVFRKINNNPSPGAQVLSDFSHYKPSGDTPASFIGGPIYDPDGNYIGVLVFQMPIEPLNRVMQVTSGMGKTGETYLVGADLLMRSDSRFYQGRSILTTTVATDSVHQALAGNQGIQVLADYRGVQVFSAYTPINILDTQWAMIVEVDEAEVMAAVYEMSRFLTISGFLLLVLISIFGYLLAQDISRPIVDMTDMMRRLSKNDLDINISVSKRGDEIGGMADAMVVFKKNAIEKSILQKKLNHLANHDSLTGLPTRQYALKTLEKLIEKSKENNSKLAIMFVDLDDFKRVNDTYGHHVGDQVLKNVAHGLSSSVRKNDIVARIGGDEFLIIVPDIDSDRDSNKIASEMIRAVGNSFSARSKKINISVSIGISIYPQHAQEPDQLIKRADSAMYTAKGGGKNSYCYWQDEVVA